MLIKDMMKQDKQVEILDNDGSHVIARPTRGHSKAYRLYKVRESTKGKYINMRGKRVYSEDWKAVTA